MVKRSRFYVDLFAKTKNLTLLYKVSATLAGRKIYIPREISKNHILGQFGVEFIDYIQELAIGKTLYIPDIYNSREIANFDISKLKILFFKSLVGLKNLINK